MFCIKNCFKSFILSLITIFFTCVPLTKEERIIEQILFPVKIKEKINSPYAFILEIKKIHLRKGIFSLSSPYNDVSKNIQLIEGSTNIYEPYSNIILASHSGRSEIAYFKHLHLLKIGDEAVLYVDEEVFRYVLVNIYDEKKDGKIKIIRKPYQDNLVLITCDQKNKDLQNVYIFVRIKD